MPPDDSVITRRDCIIIKKKIITTFKNQTYVKFDWVVSVAERHARQQQHRVVIVVILEDDVMWRAVAERPLIAGETCDATVDGHLRLNLQRLSPVHLQRLTLITHT